ncbi:MAG: FG-GAP repeat protein [Planctomycetes bacterium]|nr:FG-GAP repeat protein [Planctomycetota bacterium]
MRAFASVPVLLVALGVSVEAQSSFPGENNGDIQASSWYSEINAEILLSEFTFRELADEPGVWSAPNRPHELRSRVSSSGLEVFPRCVDASGLGAAWKVALRTTGFGREGTLHALEVPSITVEAHRTVLDHGLLQEWLENRAEGLEQGWTIPTSVNGEGPLCIDLDFCSELVLQVESGARSALLLDESDVVRARYRDLVVFDAAGRELDARLEPRPWGLRIRVDDAGAAYPLFVDPLLTGPAWTAESNQAVARFGGCVATAGDVNGDGYGDVIVGAPDYDNGQTNEGRVFVYHGSMSGLSASAAWTAESDQADAAFGSSAATAGDVNGDGYSDVIVGAFLFDNGHSNEGRGFVYLGSASGLAASAVWTAESDQANAAFGTSVACAGDVNGDGFSDVIVGAQGYDNGQTNEGRAFVYLGSASGPAASASWTAEIDQAGASFGYVVALAGDVNGDGFGDVLVGAPAYDNGEVDEGRAFAYLGSSLGLATSANWFSESNQAGALLGYSVAAAGDVNGDGYSDVVLGAPGYDNGQLDEGRAFVHMGSATGLAASALWTAESDQVGANFAQSVATAGDVNGDGFGDVIVGAPAYDGGQADEGRARVYLGSAVGTEASASWTGEPDQSGARFGSSVGTAGDVDGDGYSDVIVGAPQFDNGHADEGGGFVYHGAAGGLADTAAWAAVGAHAASDFGMSVASAGDVNGDGYGDVIVGSPDYDNGQMDEGRAYLYLGSAAGLFATASWSMEGGQSPARFGASVASAGDVNGDGFGDVIIGAPDMASPSILEGVAFVYWGSATGLAGVPAWTTEGISSSARCGSSVASAGDVNGDGYGDVIVGSPGNNVAVFGGGLAEGLLGSGSGLSSTASGGLLGGQGGAFFGSAVAGAGDVNRDGYSDVIVASNSYDNGETNEGRVFAYHGSSIGLGTTPAWSAEGNQTDADFGSACSAAGDVNGDGFADVIVGARFYDNGQVNEGRALVYLGSVAGLDASPAWIVEGDQVDANVGSSVATAGDVNGDGYSDVVVGAPGFDDDFVNEGRASVYFGSATGPSTGVDWVVGSDNPASQFGASVASAGDVDGDGFGDVIVGAWNSDLGVGNGGAAFTFLGNEGRARATLPRQQRTDGVTSIAPLGRSDSQTSFRIRATMLSAFGRTRLQMEHEVKPAMWPSMD